MLRPTPTLPTQLAETPSSEIFHMCSSWMQAHWLSIFQANVKNWF